MQIASMDHWLGKAYHKKNTEQYEHDRKEGKNAALKKLSGTQVFGRENVMRFFVVVEGKATCVCVLCGTTRFEAAGERSRRFASGSN